MHHVGAAVRLARTEPPLLVDGGLDLNVGDERPVGDAHLMDDQAAYGSLHVEHLGGAAVPAQHPGIGVLAA